VRVRVSVRSVVSFRHFQLHKIRRSARPHIRILPAAAVAECKIICPERQPHKFAVRLCAALKLAEKNEIVGSQAAHLIAPVPRTAGDVNN